jgi:hypothetical protein
VLELDFDVFREVMAVLDVLFGFLRVLVLLLLLLWPCIVCFFRNARFFGSRKAQLFASESVALLRPHLMKAESQTSVCYESMSNLSTIILTSDISHAYSPSTTF